MLPCTAPSVCSLAPASDTCRVQTSKANVHAAGSSQVRCAQRLRTCWLEGGRAMRPPLGLRPTGTLNLRLMVSAAVGLVPLPLQGATPQAHQPHEQ